MSSSIAEECILPNYSKREILGELDRILSSELFSRSSVLSNFLKFIVEETLEGNASALKEYTIAVNALGRSSDFDPQSNAIIRINAGRLRRLLNEYYSGPGISNATRIEVVKGTYVPVFRAHEINTIKTEIKGEIKNTHNPNSVPFSRSKLTLAILPFRNLCPDNEYRFFVDGFGEELTQIFSAAENIAVVAHYSTLKYATHIGDIRSVGADLGVHYVITGSVKRSDKNIKVNIGLVETLTGMQIWSKNYTHDLEKHKTVDIQDQINTDVFEILSGHYGFIITETMRLVEDEMKQNLQSFDAILWYNLTQLTHSEADCIACRHALEKVLQNEPNNVMCLIILGDLYLCSYSFGYATIDDPINEALKLINKALRLAPMSQFGNLIRGWANIYLGNKKEAIEALDYSMQLAPLSPSIKGTLGFAFACAGEYTRSRALLHEALDLNPYCPWWYYMAFFVVYYHNGKYEEALGYTLKMNASEDVYMVPLFSVAAKGQLGMIADAQEEVRLLNDKFPKILANLKIYLGSFLLDESLLDEIIDGARKAGLVIA